MFEEHAAEVAKPEQGTDTMVNGYYVANQEEQPHKYEGE